MREIVKVLLQEGIDEETIHEVLDVICEVKKRENLSVGDGELVHFPRPEDVKRKAAKDEKRYDFNVARYERERKNLKHQPKEVKGAIYTRMRSMEARNKAKEEGRI